MHLIGIRGIAKVDLMRLGVSLSVTRCCCCLCNCHIEFEWRHSTSRPGSHVLPGVRKYRMFINKPRFSTGSGNYPFKNKVMLLHNLVGQSETSRRTKRMPLPSQFVVQNRKIHSGLSLLMWWCSRINRNSFLITNVEPTRMQTRLKSRSKKKGKDREETGEESSDEDSDWTEVSYEDNLEFQDLAAGPDTFSLVKVHLKGLRADAVASVGLKMARNKIDEMFYKSKLLLNGEKLLKKGVKIDVGDYVDVVTGTKDEQTLVKRVQLVQVLKERTRTDKQIVWLRVWQSEFPVDVNSDT